MNDSVDGKYLDSFPSEHWGEFEDEENSEKVKYMLESIQGKFRNGFNNFNLPPLHQPSLLHRPPKKDIPKRFVPWLRVPVDSSGQNYLLHSVELQHYKKRMRYMLAAAHSHQMEVLKGGSAEGTSLPSPPPPPKRFCSSDGRLRGKPQQSFMSREFDVSKEWTSSLWEAKGHECPFEMDSLSARQLLLKSVAAITAHAGFEISTESSINTFTDILGDYMDKLCKLLNITVEKHNGGQRKEDLYFEALEHTFHEFGLNSIVDLQQYWNKQIKQIALKLEQADLELLSEYNSLKESSSVQRKQIKEEKG